MRNKSRQAVQKVYGIVAVCAADMHMLAKYRRLLNKITEIFQVTPIAFVIADFLTLPFLKWMRTTATNGEVLLCSNPRDYLLHSG